MSLAPSLSPLFAQRQFDGSGAPDAAFLGGFLVVIFLLLALVLAIHIFFLLTLSRALGFCRPENRDMEPWQVWLNLIPLFNIVWIFLTVLRLASSLRREFTERGQGRRDEDYGQNLGLAYIVAGLVSGLPIRVLSTVLSLACLVCFIMYWVKIAGYNQQLQKESPVGRDDYDERFDDRERVREKEDDRYQTGDQDDRISR
jgi:hypothetical protein